MILYFMRRGDRLLISEKELFVPCDKDYEETIGFPLFRLEAKGQLTGEGDDIEKMLGKMKEGKSYKFILMPYEKIYEGGVYESFGSIISK